MIFNTSQELTTTFSVIDSDLQKMRTILLEEASVLNASFDRYRTKLNKNRNLGMSKKIHVQNTLESSRQHLRKLVELEEPLANLQRVNRMISFSLQQGEGNALRQIACYISEIANICLGQLKQARARYLSILNAIKADLITLWMDREISRELRIVFSLRSDLQQAFLNLFEKIEICYADLTLGKSNIGKEGLFVRRVVLRMVSNRFSTWEEQNTLNTLFPLWEAMPQSA